MTRPLTESDKAAFRDRMCDVAQARFSQHGLQAVTMRDLAAGMGVSSMTPYRYFKDKDEILAAVRARAFTRLADAMDAAEAKLSTSDWVQPGEAYFEWAMANRDAYRLMFIEPPKKDDPELGAAMHRARERQRMACMCWNCPACCGRPYRRGRSRCARWMLSRAG